MSSQSSETSVSNTVEAQIAHMKSKTVSLAGVSGYFVSKDRLNRVEEKILEALDQAPENESPSRLIDLQEELERVRQSSEASQSHLNEVKKQLQERSDLLTKVIRDRDTQRLLAESRLKEVEKTHEQYKQSLSDAKDERERLNKLLREGPARFDPDQAKEYQEEIARLTSGIKDLQNDLELINTDKKSLRAAHDEANSKVAALTHEKNQLQKEVNEMIHVRQMVSSDQVPAITVQRPEINSKILTKMLGERGINWLHKAEQVMVDDYRNRVYNMMLATKNGHTQNLKSISQLLEIVFHWCKQKTFKARRQIAQWVDMIEAHLRAGAVRSVKFYRDKLREFVDEFEEQKAHAGVHPDEPMPWWKDAYLYARVFYNKARRQTKRTSNSFKRAFLSVVSYTKRVFAFFSRAPHVEPEDFDAEHLLASEKEAKAAHEANLAKARAGKKPAHAPKPSNSFASAKARAEALFGKK